jgi:hypothetical protein
LDNENLGAARRAKNDEFYTQFHDIQKEMEAYLDYNKNVFRDKTVLLPCDDPEWSNFTKFFAQNFQRLGLKKLISTSYAPKSKPKGVDTQPTLFELESPHFDAIKTIENGKIFILERDLTGDEEINVEDLEWSYLEGDGDFRSAEIQSLRDEADLIITNPPFSLFREFLAWILQGDKKFVFIGNMNAITYKEVFPLIKEDRAWLGATNFNEGMYFRVPSTFEYATTYKFEREREGHQVSRVPGVCWFTNLDHGRRHQPIPLMSESDNLKFSKHKEIKGVGYTKYDNFDAIEVPFTDAIPSDFEGIMGVPITFLGKYSPGQFEIIANMDNHADMKAIGVRPLSEEFISGYRAVGGTGAQRAGGYWVGLTNPNRFPYKRIFIRHRKKLN